MLHRHSNIACRPLVASLSTVTLSLCSGQMVPAPASQGFSTGQDWPSPKRAVSRQKVKRQAAVLTGKLFMARKLSEICFTWSHQRVFGAGATATIAMFMVSATQQHKRHLQTLVGREERDITWPKPVPIRFVEQTDLQWSAFG